MINMKIGTNTAFQHIMYWGIPKKYQEVLLMNKVSPGPVNSNTGSCIKEAVCIHTDKVYDSCREQECAR